MVFLLTVTAGFAAVRCDEGFGFFARAMRSSVPVKTNVMPANFVPFGRGALFFHIDADGAQMVDQFAIRGLGEKFEDAFGDLGADFGDLDQLFRGGRGELFHRAEMRGEKLRGALADEANADAVDQALEAVLFAGGDFVEQILRGFFGHALEIGERFEIELVEIGEILHQILFDELVDDFFAEAVDIHGVAAGKMQERFPSARRTGNIDAAIGDFAFGAVDARAAHRALVRHLELLFFRAVLHDFQDVRNHFTGALDEHRIARVNVEAFDFVHIVQRGLRNGDAADLHRLKNRERA